MLEPQSTLLFVLFIVTFAAMMVWLTRTSRVVLRVLAAVVAFVVATSVGVLAVNKYFDYYRTWGAAMADLVSSGPAVPQLSQKSLLAAGKHSAQKTQDVRQSLVPGSIDLSLAAKQGYTFRVQLAGRLSHISRAGYVYLPPQYFWSTWQQYKFPVIELIHGQPGAPQDWINVMGVITTFDDLLTQHLARPAVLVMPDANGGLQISLQCLNQVNGPQDMTYLGEDVPADIAAMLRVQPPGPGWGIAGYSEGGFCAANMALRLRTDYGFAGVLSGYFTPDDNMWHGPVDPFDGNSALRLENTPTVEVQALRPGERIPQFWLGAGTGDKGDVAAAEYFWQELENHQANVPLYLSPGQHTMTAWRAQVPPMLEWMTGGLAQAVSAGAHATPVDSRSGAHCGSQKETVSLRVTQGQGPSPRLSAKRSCLPQPVRPAHKV